MNITRKIEEVCKKLNSMRNFNGVEVFNASCKSEKQKIKDAELDGLTEEETSKYINDYTCFYLHLGLDDFDEHPYVNYEFDEASLQEDFIKWLIEEGVPEEYITKDLKLNGYDNEFMKPEDN